MTTSLGYTIVTVADVAATLGFYNAAFGLETQLLTPEGDYGELASGATTLAFVANELAESNLGEAGGFTPLDPSSPPPAASITLVTDDVAAVVSTAVGAGARLYVEPTTKPWGQTVAYLIDPNGFLVEIATPVGA